MLSWVQRDVYCRNCYWFTQFENGKPKICVITADLIRFLGFCAIESSVPILSATSTHCTITGLEFKNAWTKFQEYEPTSGAFPYWHNQSEVPFLKTENLSIQSKFIEYLEHGTNIWTNWSCCDNKLSLFLERLICASSANLVLEITFNFVYQRIQVVLN